MKDDRQSYIGVNKDGQAVSFIGPDATALFGAAMLRAGLSVYVKTGGKLLMTRGAGVTNMLAQATHYTGKKYKRSQAQQACDDLKIWCETMKAALPIVKGH